MAKIYAAPKHIELPVFDYRNMKQSEENENAYYEAVRLFCVTRSPNDKYAGKIARFPVADGFAEYMVLSIKPLALIHLPIGDAWDYRHIERLTVKDIKENIDRSATLAMQ